MNRFHLLLLFRILLSVNLLDSSLFSFDPSSSLSQACFVIVLSSSRFVANKHLNCEVVDSVMKVLWRISENRHVSIETVCIVVVDSPGKLFGYG
jgi:hypothetical protein